MKRVQIDGLKTLADRRRHIEALINRDNIEFQNPDARLERKNLANLETDKLYPMWLELEFFAHDIRPTATTIVMYGVVDEPHIALAKLQQRTLFGINGFAEWYFDESAEYPKTKSNADTLEYIRLLTIEYINLQMQST